MLSGDKKKSIFSLPLAFGLDKNNESKHSFPEEKKNREREKKRKGRERRLDVKENIAINKIITTLRLFIQKSFIS
jgi:hypothetical protein